MEKLLFYKKYVDHKWESTFALHQTDTRQQSAKE